jgi:hypothetical protein
MQQGDSNEKRKKEARVDRRACSYVEVDGEKEKSGSEHREKPKAV